MSIYSILSRTVEVSHYFNKENTLVLKLTVNVKVFGITIRKIPLFNMSDKMGYSIKNTMFELIRDNVEVKRVING